jgi:ribosomal protein L25 (general stress protein Ctc)
MAILKDLGYDFDGNDTNLADERMVILGEISKELQELTSGYFKINILTKDVQTMPVYAEVPNSPYGIKLFEIVEKNDGSFVEYGGFKKQFNTKEDFDNIVLNYLSDEKVKKTLVKMVQNINIEIENQAKDSEDGDGD